MPTTPGTRRRRCSGRTAWATPRAATFPSCAARAIRSATLRAAPPRTALHRNAAQGQWCGCAWATASLRLMLGCSWPGAPRYARRSEGSSLRTTTPETQPSRLQALLPSRRASWHPCLRRPCATWTTRGQLTAAWAVWACPCCPCGSVASGCRCTSYARRARQRRRRGSAAAPTRAPRSRCSMTPFRWRLRAVPPGGSFATPQVPLSRAGEWEARACARRLARAWMRRASGCGSIA
mmetsp:Transcript_21692/g.55641  ORF Transcript_21692/g.55641 Transcript_21692/m.55641 type:complete len:236 (-) Transcript_21692:118-825(-)